MIKLYAADVSALSYEKLFDKYYDLIDETRREKLCRCKKEEDKKRSILAGYLIQAGIKEWIYEESGLQSDATPLSLTYTYGEEGKPYLKEYEDIYFSISHSGSYVICAFSEQEIGADIQEHRKVKEGLADRFFSEADRRFIRDMGTEDGFYKVWAVKEAFMKLTGEGMKQGLDAALINPDGEDAGIHTEKNSAYFKIYDTIKKYSIAVCSYEKISDIDIRIIQV